ncbi:MAG TPA: hypothetical protein VF323_03855, partial [Candidatus Limnocylindrales bacterium]
MPEILTESFCERCGTRYTFQSTAPKVGRLAKMKVLSRGLKNYVLSDEASLDEALSDARSSDDRQHSVEQLDAFHKTFNFCMSCRQYTCGNCWNELEGRCLSCAPSLSVGVLPSSYPSLNPVAGIGAIGGNGNGHTPALEMDAFAADPTAWPEVDLPSAPDQPASVLPSSAAADKPVSRLEALFGREAAARIEANAPRTEDDSSEMIGLEGLQAEDVEPAFADLEAEAPEELEIEAAEEPVEVAAAKADDVLTVADDEPAAEDAGAGVQSADEPGLAAVAAAEEPVEEPAEEPAAAEEAIAAIAVSTEEADEDGLAAAAELEPEPAIIHPVDPETDELAAAAAAQTHGLLDKFRARPEAMPAPRPTEASTPWTVPTPASRPAAPAYPPFTLPPIAPGAAQMPYAASAAQPTPQPFGALSPYATPPAPQPYGAGLPYAAQAPQAYPNPGQQPYGAPGPQPYAAPAGPVQPYPAPASPYGAQIQPSPYPAVQPQYAAPAPPPAAPAAPSWRMVAPEGPWVAPAAPNNGHVHEAGPPSNAPEPQWPAAPAWPAPVARTSRTRGAEAVWAESTRDLLNRPETGVSACFNCGLPLSATARFCRRCGTSQI